MINVLLTAVFETLLHLAFGLPTLWKRKRAAKAQSKSAA